MKKKEKFKLNDDSRRYVFDTSKQIAAVSLIALGFVINLVISNQELVHRLYAAFSVVCFCVALIFTMICQFAVTGSSGKKKDEKRARKGTINFLLWSWGAFFAGIMSFSIFAVVNILA